MLPLTLIQSAKDSTSMFTNSKEQLMHVNHREINWWKDKATAVSNLWKSLGMFIAHPQHKGWKWKWAFTATKDKPIKRRKRFYGDQLSTSFEFFLFLPLHSISYCDRQWCFLWSSQYIKDSQLRKHCFDNRPCSDSQGGWQKTCERDCTLKNRVAKSLSALHLSSYRLQTRLSSQVSDLLCKHNRIFCSVHRHTAMAVLHLKDRPIVNFLIQLYIWRALCSKGRCELQMF